MRDLLFKNLTSQDKRKRVISTLEINEEEGIYSIIRRHFICLIKEIKDKPLPKPLPCLYILRETNHKKQLQKFFYRIKASVYIVRKEGLFQVLFAHSLMIILSNRNAS
ncbi:MAG: hypothetical protein NC912_06165 [Candidatus Omnitrophica bacterium]|nr:hypothetical protein [Candidatus Omnitrophota bacterium]